MAFADADRVIRTLGLEPHPEGGHYREVHRSAVAAGVPVGYPGERVALTAIYFLLRSGEFSAFHRVRSEEVWVHLAGAPLELLTLSSVVTRQMLAPPGEPGSPLAVVPPATLQAARSAGPWTLVTCLVAPGFEFADFELADRAGLLAAHPEHKDLIRQLTR